MPVHCVSHAPCRVIAYCETRAKVRKVRIIYAKLLMQSI
jgi:hypothetical protein